MVHTPYITRPEQDLDMTLVLVVEVYTKGEVVEVIMLNSNSEFNTMEHVCQEFEWMNEMIMLLLNQ